MRVVFHMGVKYYKLVICLPAHIQLFTLSFNSNHKMQLFFYGVMHQTERKTNVSHNLHVMFDMR